MVKHVYWESAAAPQCVTLPAPLTGSIFTLHISKLFRWLTFWDKDKNLGQLMAATQASYFSVVCWEDSGDLVRPTQQSETLACSVLRLEARDYVTPAFCSALAVDSCSGSAGVSQVNLRFPVKSRALLIKQNVLGSRPLQLEHPWAKHWILWRKEPPITKGEVLEINKSRDVKQ